MGKWKPNKKFIEFLEWIEKKDGNVALTGSGEKVTDKMKNGDESVRSFYDHLYNDNKIQEAYQNWKKRRKQGR